MRPKTRFQYEVVAANEKLLQLTEAPIEWGYQKTINHYAYRTASGKTTCMDCGHQWSTEHHSKYARCPKCNAYLKIKDTRLRTMTDKSYFSIVSTQDGLQLQRIFLMEVKTVKGSPAQKSVMEIARYWTNEQGKTAVTALKRTMGFYRDTFVRDGNLELRYDNEVYAYLSDSYVYPHYEVLPILKRNGLRGSIADMPFQALIQGLLKDSRIETLLKTGRKRELSYFLNHQRELDACWASLRIVLRHNYKIADVSLWVDYIRLLDKCGKDLNNAFYVCPTDLCSSHDRFLKMAERIREREEKERQRQIAIQNEARFKELKEKFFGLSFTDGTIIVSVLESIQEYYNEGKAMHHCVGQSEYFLKPHSLVFSARIDGQRIETVELSLKTFQVIQSRGLCNKNTKHHQHIINLVHKNVPLVQQRMLA